ncbi:alkaline phosphatase family protein [Silvibacterium acidisoli]|uniref:alkaline phosphatase family protein n=1 Tax=Acidobacteriaceae bacterium ZG23-2 TaxID=2883246 RepID=UPI00406C683E
MTSTTSISSALTPSVATGKVKHVFVIVLENENYATTFGATSKAPYLSQTLTAKGALLSGYYGTGHVSLDNYISMISGQAGTLQTIADCQTYADFSQTGITYQDSQYAGTGCVYPASTPTLPGQMKAAGLTWKGYMGDMGNDPARESATCGHPKLNAADLTQIAEAPSAAVPAGDMYATRHDPFMYFHSIIDSSDCAKNVVNLDSNLQTDLASASTTPNLTFITPDLCDDGHDAPCADGRPGGLTSANAFLQKWIPIIQASPAYQQDGLIIINFDESSYASITVPSANVYNIVETGTFCCGQKPGPNLGTYPQSSTFAGPPTYNITYNNYGGDNTGAVLLSPFIKAGTVSNVPYNHYSMLRSLEDIFGLTHIGYAGDPALVPFGNDIFNNL